MRSGFPIGFLSGFLSAKEVSCFFGAKSHREFRKLFAKPLDSTGRQRFPAMETVSTLGNQMFPGGFLDGFLLEFQQCP